MAPLWARIKASRTDADGVLGHLGMREPPIDPWAVARELQVEVRAVDRPGWAGAVQSDRTRAVVWLNAGEPKLLQRFTLAHELGHLLLHATGATFRDLTFGGSQEETQANMFARRLLMPPWMLEPVFSHLGDVEKTAEVFEVPPTTMRLWLEHLGIA